MCCGSHDWSVSFSHIYSVAALSAANGLFSLAYGSSAASLPSVSTATPSTNKPQRCLRQTFREGTETFQQLTLLGKRETNGKKRTKNMRRTEWCFSFSFLLATVNDCVPDQLTLNVLLNMVNFSSIPFLITRSLSRQRYKGSVAWGVLCSAFYHNNNGARKPSDPRSFWGWHIRLRYSPTPSHLSLVLLLLILSIGFLSHSKSDMPYTLSLYTNQCERRWDGVSSTVDLWHWQQLHPQVLSSQIATQPTDALYYSNKAQLWKYSTVSVTSVLIHPKRIIL